MSTGLVSFAVVVQESVPVTFPASDAGEYVIAGLEGDRRMLGVVPYALLVLTVAVRSGVVMMLPLLFAPMTQRAALHAAALMFASVPEPALSADVGPLSG